MSRTKLPGFRASGWAYVCETWVECRADNNMWQAVSEEIYGLEPDGWECACGKPMNVRIHIDEARKAVVR